MPEAAPARSLPTASITTVVRGAMVTAIPEPRITNAGKNESQYSAPTPGTANSENPAAAISGPTIKGALAPYRVTRPPDHRESENTRKMSGRAAAPVAVGEYPCT